MEWGVLGWATRSQFGWRGEIVVTIDLILTPLHNLNTITSNFSRTLFDYTMESSRRFAAGNQAEQTGENRKPRRADETRRPSLHQALHDSEREFAAHSY